MIDIDEVLERLSNGAEDVICKEYELRPQKIAELTKSVAEKTEKQGYVIIGMGNKDNGYSINGINFGIDIEALVSLALQQIHSKIRAEYQVFSLEGKRVCVIGVERYIEDKKQLSSETKIERREKVFKDLLNACIKLQKNNTFINVSEDQRNDFIRDILETSGYQIKDQTRQGKSASGKSSGEIDILLHDKGKPISVVEALNLNGLETAYLDEHIDKVYKYDTSGNAFNFLVSYVKVKNFGEFWEKYVEHIKKYKYPYEIIETRENDSKEYQYTDIRHINTIHNRNGRETTLCHICVKIVE